VAVARAGGIEAVITAMRTHLSHADVQHYGCRALNNIAWLLPFFIMEFGQQPRGSGEGRRD